MLEYQEQSVLDLLKAHVQSQEDEIYALQKKAQYNFTVSNILAAILAGFNIESVSTADPNAVEQLRLNLLGLMGIFYVCIAALSTHVILVRPRLTRPMDPSAKNVEEWSTCSLVHHKKILADSYLLVYQDLEEMNSNLAGAVKVAQSLILFAIVVFMLTVYYHSAIQ